MCIYGCVSKYMILCSFWYVVSNCFSSASQFYWGAFISWNVMIQFLIIRNVIFCFLFAVLLNLLFCYQEFWHRVPGSKTFYLYAEVQFLIDNSGWGKDPPSFISAGSLIFPLTSFIPFTARPPKSITFSLCRWLFPEARLLWNLFPLSIKYQTGVRFLVLVVGLYLHGGI